MWKEGDLFMLAREVPITRGGDSFKRFCRESFRKGSVLTVFEVLPGKVLVEDVNFNLWEFLFEDIIPLSLENE